MRALHVALTHMLPPRVAHCSSYDSSEVYTSALDTATQLRTVAALMRNVASRATPQNAQQVRAQGRCAWPGRPAKLGSPPRRRPLFVCVGPP